MKKQFLLLLKNLLAFLNPFKQRNTILFDERTEVRIKIEEVPNNDILIYHLTDKLTDMKWSFESPEDLQRGGIYSINFEEIEVPKEIQNLAGILLVSVNGLKRVDISKYEIRFEKSPAFEWREIESEILLVLKKELAGKRRISISERTRTGIDVRGYTTHTKIHSFRKL